MNSMRIGTFLILALLPAYLVFFVQQDDVTSKQSSLLLYAFPACALYWGIAGGARTEEESKDKFLAFLVIAHPAVIYAGYLACFFLRPELFANINTERVSPYVIFLIPAFLLGWVSAMISYGMLLLGDLLNRKFLSTTLQ